MLLLEETTVLLYFALNGKFVNSRTFESLNILKYWSCQARKRETHYDLKEMENIKNSKIVSIAWHHNVLTEMFAITEKSALLYEKVKFLISLNPSRHHRLLLIICR